MNFLFLRKKLTIYPVVVYSCSFYIYNKINMASLMYNNSSISLTSKEFRNEIKRYLANLNYTLSFVQIFIVLFGVFGNILALVVINRKSLRNTSPSVYITYLAIFDSCVLLLHGANLARPGRYLFIHCSLTYLTDLATFCANWILVIITLERCVAVSSPFLAKRFCTVDSARRSIYIFLTISIIFFSITFPFIYDIKRTSKIKKCVIRSHFVLILRIYQVILFYAIPDVLLLSNLYTLYALCQRTQRFSSVYLKDEQKLNMRKSDINSSGKQRQLTIMLVTVSLSFYLFTTPAMILFIREYHPVKHHDINKIKQNIFFSQMSVILLQLNDATNFIFFCFTGQRFRQATIQTFYEYSERLNIFYHRYILCNKQYNSIPSYQNHLNNFRQTTTTIRNSYVPCYNQSHYRTSII
ncbi:unnamed protein product [Rotaria sordida]|uniref:G-protein coupled receptors family 1 profile domain-containing protein n=2 Tax=Rotaria sordida TaxID=392033 RepID=A0A813YPU9_9BILA|nr:unnamed protein product [Rotaria sordida]CAF0887414.1 unnamed protein product [Rotaria sordida]